MQDDTSGDAPADLLKFASDLFRTRASNPQLSPVKRFFAKLSVDLAPNRAAFGERSAGGSQARQMLFETEENAVDLRLTRIANGFAVRGQIMGDGFDGGTIRFKSGKHEAAAEIDEMSGFYFREIPAGEYSVTVKNSDAEISIDGLHLQ